MNISTEAFLAFRYLKPKRTANSIITVLSLLGVIVGAMVLIVVLAVMAGMTKMQEDNLLASVPHLQVSYEKGIIEDAESVTKTVTEQGLTAAPLIEGECVVQLSDSFDYQSILGVDGSVENTPLGIGDKMIGGSPNLNIRNIVISNWLAQRYGLMIGGKLNIHSPLKLGKMIGKYQNSKEKGRDVIYLPEEFTVTGVYRAGRYDKNYIYMNIDDAAEFIDQEWGTASSIYIRTADPFNIDPVKKKLESLLPENKVQTWKELHKEWLDVLAMERTMMLFMLGFIILVAAFSITNTLITVTIQKTREIGLLKSLGATSGSIMRVFLLQGFLIGVMGAALGISAGLSIIYFRNSIISGISSLFEKAGLVVDFYFLNNMPAEIVRSDVWTVAVIAVVLCTVGGLIPAWRASRLDPARALRYE